MSIRFGLLGTGYWADTVHAAGLAVHEGAELVAVWGRDPAKASAVAARHGIAAEPDLDALLGMVDAVAIAVPPDVQPELACRAAQAGCHLLLEKPLALSAGDAERVAAATDAAGVASLVFFTARFAEPAASWLDEAAARGGWEGGSLLLLASIFGADNPFGRSPWRREHGALWDIGPHALASLLPALGPVVEVVAAPGPGDTVHLALVHSDGAASSATLSLTVPEAAVESAFLLWGAGGVARAPQAGPVGDAYRRAVSELLRAIASGTPHACDVRFGAEVVRVLAAAERFLGRTAGRGESPG